MKYILDTCSISELVKSAPSQKVITWVDKRADVDLYLTVVTIGEIRKGIEAARPTNLAAAQKNETWLNSLITHYADRILPLDEPAAQTWGMLMARTPNSGVEDAQIAAIALTRGMTVVTRNLSDFKPFPVAIFDPF